MRHDMRSKRRPIPRRAVGTGDYGESMPRRRGLPAKQIEDAADKPKVRSRPKPPKIKPRTQDVVPPSRMKKGGATKKSYKSGGKVRGAGCAKKGVRAAKNY